MSVLTNGCRDSRAADGVTAAFAYGFRILDAAHLTVTLRDQVTGAEMAQALNAHYTVTGVGAPGGGTVIFPVPPPVGRDVVIARAMPAGNHGYPVVPVELALDRLVLLAQQAQDSAARSVRFPEGDSPALSARLPGSAERAGKALAFDANGNVTLVSLASPIFDGGAVEWSELRNLPRTLDGFGILDAAPLGHVGAGAAAHAAATPLAGGFMSAADKAKLDRLEDAGGAGVLRGCLLTLIQSQRVEAGAAATVAWDSAVWDGEGAFQPSDPTRLTVPANVRFLRLTAALEIEAAMNGRRNLTIRRNGSADYPGRSVAQGCGNGTGWNRPPRVATPWLPVVAGDWFDLHLDQTSSVAFDLLGTGGCWLQAEFA